MFSILIPTFNNLKYLELCINSIRKNLKYNHQIIPYANIGDNNFYLSGTKMHNGQIPFVCSDNINNFDVKFFLNNDALRQKIAKRSRNKYFKYFNSTVIAEFIINKIFKINKRYYWENKD